MPQATQILPGAVLILMLAFNVPVSAQVINAWAKIEGGAMRMVADQSDCTSRETPISWNVEGPAGPPGESGSDPMEGDSRRVLGTADIYVSDN